MDFIVIFLDLDYKKRKLENILRYQIHSKF